MSGIFENIQPPMVAAVGGAATIVVGGAAYALRSVFNKMSGAPSIGRNVANIWRSTRNFADMNGLDHDAVVKAPIDCVASKVHGILFINAEHASLSVQQEDGVRTMRMDLRSEARMAQLEQAKAHLMDFEKLQKEFVTPHPLNGSRSLLKIAKKARKSWVRPTVGQRVSRMFSERTAHEEMASRINDAEMEVVKIMAASEQEDINLSGACHIAVKWMDENDKAWIVVMPTNKEESELMKDIRDGLFSPEPCDARTIVSQLSQMHRKPDMTGASRVAALA